MKNQMDFNPELLYRYFKGRYSKKDKSDIKDVFNDINTRSLLKKHMEKQWHEFNETEDSETNLNYLLNNIHHKIRLEEEALKIKRLTITFQRIAAIIILPLILAFAGSLYLNQYKKHHAKAGFAEIQCPLGVRTQFTLPDGTTGFLNSGSSLKYPVVFADVRKVNISGEAYFEVFHDEKHPFVVTTNNLNVKVLGTKFNVIAYNGEMKEEVILNQGKVQISNLNNKELYVLKPNEKLELDKENGNFKVNAVESEQYTSWTEGKLIFRNENMLEVAERLSRWYNVDIIIADKELLSYTFRATFIDESLTEVLTLLSLTAPFEFEVSPRNMNNNTYGKKKIILTLDKRRIDAFR